MGSMWMITIFSHFLIKYIFYLSSIMLLFLLISIFRVLKLHVEPGRTELLYSIDSMVK